MKKTIFAACIIGAAVMFAVPAYAGVDISAECAVVIDAATGRVICDRNAEQQHSMASTTKITTAITALENSTLDSIITMDEESAAQEGSSTYLHPGDQLTMEEMLYGLLLNSGNDAAWLVAKQVGGDVDTFVSMMNETAKRAGARNTQYKNPSGLDAEGHYTTALDLAKIARYAMNNDVFADIVRTRARRVTVLNRPADEQYFVNHNKLLEMYEGCSGVKTGYTQATGRCLVSSATRNGMTFIAVTLNAPDDWNDHMKLLDFAFANNTAKNIVAEGQVLKTETIDGTEYNFTAEEGYAIAEPLDTTIDTVTEVHMFRNLAGPVKAGDKVGYAAIFYGGEQVGKVNIVSEQDINTEKTLWPAYTMSDWFAYLAESWLKF